LKIPGDGKLQWAIGLLVTIILTVVGWIVVDNVNSSGHSAGGNQNLIERNTNSNIVVGSGSMQINERSESDVLRIRAFEAVKNGNHDRAKSFLQESADISLDEGDFRGAASDYLHMLGHMMADAGPAGMSHRDKEEGLSLIERSERLAKGHDFFDTKDYQELYMWLAGDFYAAIGDWKRARAITSTFTDSERFEAMGGSAKERTDMRDFIQSFHAESEGDVGDSLSSKISKLEEATNPDWERIIRTKQQLHIQLFASQDFEGAYKVISQANEEAVRHLSVDHQLRRDVVRQHESASRMMSAFEHLEHIKAE
jgi:hypothetical protein